MLSYLLSNDNNVSYNLIIGKIFGVYSAIFINLILTEYNKAYVSHKLYQDKYVGLNRDYVFEKTLIVEQKQIDIEDNLSECGVLERVKSTSTTGRFYYRIDEAYLMKIIDAKKDDKLEFTLAPRKQSTSSDISKKVTKKQLAVAEAMREVNILEVNAEVRDLYAIWIDTIITRFGYIAKGALKLNIQDLNAYSKNDVAVKKAVLSIAAKNGWKDIQYSINDYEKDHKTGSVNTRSSSQNKYQVTTSEEKKEEALAETLEKLKRGGSDVF